LRLRYELTSSATVIAIYKTAVTPSDHDIALWNLPVVPGRQNEIFPALSFVWPGNADIDDPAVLK
jgi:hypothetical protein